MVDFSLTLTSTAQEQFQELKSNHASLASFKAVKKALKLLGQNPRHPSLHTHQFTSMSEEFGKKVFETYAQNNTPSAYRIFWHYGDTHGEIRVVAIVPHP